MRFPILFICPAFLPGPYEARIGGCQMMSGLYDKKAVHYNIMGGAFGVTALLNGDGVFGHYLDRHWQRFCDQFDQFDLPGLTLVLMTALRPTTNGLMRGRG